jgi:hypothetical protein
MKLNIGDRVTNRIGRQGKVIAADDRMVSILFSSKDGRPDNVGWFERENDYRLTLVTDK